MQAPKTITVETYETAHRYPRVIRVIEEGWKSYKSRHSTTESGYATPYQVVETGEKGTLYLPPH